MYSILYIALHGFYTRTQESKRVVVHEDGKLLGAEGEVLGRGVKAGTPLSEARAILGDSVVFGEYRADDYRSKRDEWLDVCTAFSDGVEHSHPHEAYVDLTGHPTPSGVAIELLRALFEKEAAFTITAGMAPGKWVALLSSREVDMTANHLGILSFEPVSDVAAFLSAIPTRMLSPLPREHRDKLEFLGYRWAREVAVAPVTGLADQFGKDAFLIREVANGRAMDGVSPNYPESSVSAAVAFGCPLDDSVTLTMGIESLTRQLASDLCSRDAMAKGLSLFIECEGVPPLIVRRNLAKPVQAATPLRAAVTALYSQARAMAPPTAVRVQLFGLEPAPRGQKSMMGMEGAKERSRACDSAVNVLRAAYGVSAVKPAAQIALPRRERVLSVWRHATGWR